ncbi:hypothetical protein [Gallaecimonas pentaromativorans]|uniref:Uncharacterized protein n=1 Tax=Gallaecimonas pentaromativorans TaxID=584787 RepID=A0A3N1PJH9_9GAMM|nr:hypothetical protein [Gallaecimonas pentaromativorans]ROQ28795.1 hypothetical protein EDC28_103390 [Gallaecimonas pentaromativorans]
MRPYYDAPILLVESQYEIMFYSPYGDYGSELHSPEPATEPQRHGLLRLWHWFQSGFGGHSQSSTAANQERHHD